MKTAEFGTIIHGTLKSGDLIEAFAAELKGLDDEYECVELLKDCEAFQNLPDAEYCEEKAGYLVNDLMDALDQAAPDFCYFGASEGDGSDFGFWMNNDALREGIHDGSVVLREDSSRVNLFMPDYVYHISDHGNPTLYKIELTMIW